jgi:plasmid segregation protein ParM
LKTPVFAIDVGYGNTKWAYRAASNTIATGMFPSLAPLMASRTLSTFGDGALAARTVATVKIGDIEYEVGPDVSLTAAYGKTGRTLSDDFVTTNNYSALLGGALHFANVTQVEQLVLGLPVHNYGKYSDALKEKFSGELDFGLARIKVGGVSVLPQPIGSLILASVSRPKEFGRGAEHLVIDVGYFTTDWVYANGFAMDDKRSDGIPGGASQIYQHIAALISRDQGEPVEEIELIDKALREQNPFFFYGTHIDLAPYLERAQPLIAGIIHAIQNKVGRLTNVRSILLSGGGAALYATAIRKAFPRVALEIVEAPCMANARGFLTVGEARVKTQTAK